MNRPDIPMHTLRATEIYSNTATRIIVIESIHCNREKSDGFYRLYAGIKPTAMIICGAGDNIVVNLASTEISLEELKMNVRGLQTLLDKD